MDKLQGRIASFESRSVTREDFFQNKSITEQVPGDRLALHYSIEIPTGWKPDNVYYCKNPKTDKNILRAPVNDPKPTEYEVPKLKTLKAASYADPFDCKDPVLAAELKQRCEARVVPFDFDKNTNRPIVCIQVIFRHYRYHCY